MSHVCTCVVAYSHCMSSWLHIILAIVIAVWTFTITRCLLYNCKLAKATAEGENNKLEILKGIARILKQTACHKYNNDSSSEEGVKVKLDLCLFPPGLSLSFQIQGFPALLMQWKLNFQRLLPLLNVGSHLIWLTQNDP